MATGWRRAFCTSIPSDPETEKHQTQSPKSCSSQGVFSAGASNPSTTPRLLCRTAVPLPTPPAQDSPRLQCKATMAKSPRLFQSSTPSSPKSPSSLLTLFKTRSNCGICSQSVKTGQGSAIFTAECSHSFHFHCIAARVRKENTLVCPVCSITWKDAPLLAIHKNQQQETEQNHNNRRDVEKKKPISSNCNSKLYDDDEPLIVISPKGTTQFNPIPEVDEDDPENITEFQGFFANPSQPSDKMNGWDFDRVETALLPEAAIVSVSRTYEGYAMVLKVKAPPPAPLLDPARRAPIDLLTVLDVSGSMTGAKLQMLKRSMRLVVGSLGSTDRLSIVAFSARAKRLLPLTRMTALGQRSARRIIDRLACSQSQGTCVGDALKKATKVLEDRRERNPVASVMLLSDGQDDRAPNNAANRSRQSPHVSSTRFSHVEIPVHAFGYGQQQSSHLPTVDAFAKCVGGLLSVVVQDVRLQLGFSAGSAPAEISAVYSINGRPSFIGAGSVLLGDLYAEEERELVVEMRVPTYAAGSHHVMSVRCSYKDPATHELVQCKDRALLVPRPQAVRSSDPKIQRLRNLFITTKAVAEARRQADLACAYHMLSSARALLMHSSSSSLSISADENIRALDEELAALNYRRQQDQIQRRRIYDPEVRGEPLTPRSAWRAAEQLAKVAMMRKSLNRVSDLHGFENARF
ncbi:hypothetical protein AAC387_Pa05g2058 [Persea americana]